MTPNRRVIACAALLLLFVPAPALAGPTCMTDDPEPVELRHWEVYLASQSTFSRGGVTGTAPPLEVNYGAAPGLQLHVIGPLVSAAGGCGPSSYGQGDLELRAKYRFLDEERVGVQVGTCALDSLFLGCSSERSTTAPTLKPVRTSWCRSERTAGRSTSTPTWGGS